MPPKQMITGIIFSKDRALQLDGTLRTLTCHCRDRQRLELNILYRTSNDLHAEQYQELKRRHHSCRFIEENNFREDFLDLCQGAEYLLFLVDDNIFVQDFSLAEVIAALEEHPDSLGFSLRLGEGNHHFYMADQTQTIPPFTATNQPEIFCFSWTAGTGDFAFPLEVSSSVYRQRDLWPFLSRIDFANPNSLEHSLAPFRHRLRDLAPRLLTYRQPRTFCNPVNIVNTVCRCRAGNRREYGSNELSELFAAGFRLDGERYRGFVPESCHQEVDLHLTRENLLTELKGNQFEHRSSPLSTARKLKAEFQRQGLDEAADQVYDKYLAEHPTDRGLLKIIRQWEEQTAAAVGRIPGVTVVVPAYNCAATIAATLDSIIDSFHFCASIMAIDQPGEWGEIIVVNDNSSDQTAAVVENYGATPFTLTLLSNDCNLGAGPCRNRGAAKARGELLFFLDGDDLFFEEHILVCLHQLLRYPELHFIQTGIRIDEEILPVWKQAIENSVPFNFCVRKWCHDCLGGYPEGEAFQALRCEDAFYRTLLKRFFLGGRIERETMQHFRYPGNALDRQLEKFSRPPQPGCSEEVLSPAEAAAFPAIKQRLAEKTAELENRFARWAEKMQQARP